MKVGKYPEWFNWKFIVSVNNFKESWEKHALKNGCTQVHLDNPTRAGHLYEEWSYGLMDDLSILASDILNNN